MECGRSGDQHVSACSDDMRRRIWGNTAIDLDVYWPLANHRPHRGDLIEHGGNERLTAKAWIDGHDKYQIDPVQHILDGIWRCCRA